VTVLEPGSMWNTMPCHTHERRTEVYFYFDLPEDHRVVHLMGRPDETRNLIVANRQVVISPSWSVHCGFGTRSYAFVWPYQMPSRVGMSLRLHSTAIGKAILAELSDDEVLAVAGRTGLVRLTPNTLTSDEDLLAHLEGVRARGYAIDDEENEPSIRCVGAAVFDHTGQVLGGISVSALAMDMTRETLETLAPEVMSAAREVSLALGAPITLARP
jgi:hypothetical protein